MSTSTFRPLVCTILKALALAMGVASVVLVTLGVAAPANSLTLLSFGLAALALVHFIEK